MFITHKLQKRDLPQKTGSVSSSTRHAYTKTVAGTYHGWTDGRDISFTLTLSLCALADMLILLKMVIKEISAQCRIYYSCFLYICFQMNWRQIAQGIYGFFYPPSLGGNEMYLTSNWSTWILFTFVNTSIYLIVLGRYLKISCFLKASSVWRGT